ncbi:hypothetical protein ABMY09_20450 [Vibrio vulnificus]|uniref:hypothetical protein n=1 Tax=Vibrio vulnificus TaxID=672 RepID=UPI004058A706
MALVLLMYLGYFIVACLLASACMRIRYLLIKIINVASPHKRVLLTRATYSGFYIPFNACFALLFIASVMKVEQVFLFLIAIVCSGWLLLNTVKYINNINDIGISLRVIPIVYLSLPLAFIGAYGGFVVNLIWGVAMHSPRYQGNTDIIRNYMR